MRNLSRAELDAFFCDERVRWLLASARENRALKIAFPKEIHISNLFAWLLSPNEGHGLGDLAIKELLLRVWEAGEEHEVGERLGRFLPAYVVGASFGNTVVLREYVAPAEAGRLDLVLIDPVQKLVIAIENKYGARQGSQQLRRYADALEFKLRRKEDWQLVCVLLDYDTESVPADTRWFKLDYEWVTKLIRSQVELGLIAQESAATLQQFAEHLEDEDLVPYPSLDDAKATAQAIAIAHLHPAVMQVMRELRAMSVDDSVNELLMATQGAVALEYIRRRPLWDHVLDTGARADLLVPVQKAFPAVKVDFESSTCRSYFSPPNWLQCWSASPSDEEDLLWPIYALVYEHERAGEPVYRVAADFFPGRVKPHLVDNLRKRALVLRAKNGISAKGLGSRVQRIRLGEWECASKEEALPKLIQLMRDIDVVLFDAHP